MTIQKIIMIGALALSANLGACAEPETQASAEPAPQAQSRNLAQTSASTNSACNLAQGPTGPGRQHLALVIGVGDYAAGHIPDLNGTVNDAGNFKTLLTNPDGAYKLAEKDVCLLTDRDASLSGVLGAAKSFLLDRIDNEDHVTIFYAGHGGQVPDFSGGGKESDGRDETLVLYDSETPIDGTPDQDAPHLTDDVFGALLDQLNAKLTEGRPGAHALTVILDSCNSLSATRGGEFTARFLNSKERYKSASGRQLASSSAWLSRAGLGAVANALDQDSGVESVASVAPPGAVILAAAGDGRFALEIDGQGVFTRALVQEMALATRPLTYSQLEWRVRSAMKDDYQVPGFHGNTNALLFNTEIRGSGIAHKVVSVSNDKLSLIGTPIFGIGPGAEFRIYDGALEGDVSDPSLGKAIVTITGGSAVNPEAEVTGLDDEAEINIGDLAVMITPSPDARKLRVALSADLEAEFASALKAAIAEKEEYERGISLVDADDRYEFIVAAPGGEEINISDVEGKSRNTVKANEYAAGGVAKVLSGFSRQKSLRALRGEGGGTLEDNVSLKVSLEPFHKPGARTLCNPAYPTTGVPANDGKKLINVPVCSQYKFVVEADAETLSEEIQVGVLYLSSDGNIYSIPGNLRAAQNAQAFRLSPTNSSTKEPGNLRIVLDDVYQALPPPEAEDEVLVFGVTAKTPVPWWSLATNVNSQTRSAVTVRSQLHREIESFMFAGTRNGASVGSDEPLSTWTISRIGLQVVADQAALEEFAGARGGSDVAPDWDDVFCKERECKTGGE